MKAHWIEVYNPNTSLSSYHLTRHVKQKEGLIYREQIMLYNNIKWIINLIFLA
jgi:hypothetical protein